ncbi:hypothetical protein BHM03_00014978 [Ensete ventricosum]|nr:hypothetical protein BHM03_00014978 [Ensete ventricosum]
MRSGGRRPSPSSSPIVPLLFDIVMLLVLGERLICIILVVADAAPPAVARRRPSPPSPWRRQQKHDGSKQRDTLREQRYRQLQDRTLEAFRDPALGFQWESQGKERNWSWFRIRTPDQRLYRWAKIELLRSLVLAQETKESSAVPPREKDFSLSMGRGRRRKEEQSKGLGDWRRNKDRERERERERGEVAH